MRWRELTRLFVRTAALVEFGSFRFSITVPRPFAHVTLELAHIIRLHGDGPKSRDRADAMLSHVPEVHGRDLASRGFAPRAASAEHRNGACRVQKRLLLTPSQGLFPAAQPVTSTRVIRKDTQWPDLQKQIPPRHAAEVRRVLEAPGQRRREPRRARRRRRTSRREKGDCPPPKSEPLQKALQLG